MTRRNPFAGAVLAPRIAPPPGGSMSYDPPPDCATCGHLAVVHRDWFTPRPKECITHADGKRCDCRAYVRSTT